MNVVINAVCKEDFKEVYPLFEQLWPNKLIDKVELQRVFDRGVESATDELFCAKTNDKIVDFCACAIVNSLWQEGYILYVYAMVVDERYRGQGSGTVLIDEVINKSKECGYKRIELDSGFPEEKAHKFYEKLGFEKRAYLFSNVL